MKFEKEPLWIKLVLFGPMLSGLFAGIIRSNDTLGFLYLIFSIFFGGFFSLITALFALIVFFATKKLKSKTLFYLSCVVPSIFFSALLIFLAFDN